MVLNEPYWRVRRPCQSHSGAIIWEGGEDENMFEPLRMHQCDEVQGYYFARPMPADEFSPFIKHCNTLLIKAFKYALSDRLFFVCGNQLVIKKLVQYLKLPQAAFG